MRLIEIDDGEYYHVFNRGMHKQKIFHEFRDYARFLFQILHFQSDVTFPNITEDSKSFTRNLLSKNNRPSGFIKDKMIEKINHSRSVALVAFILMPNHFHLIIKELADGKGIPMYMQRTQNGYTKYLNNKLNLSGHIFQGPYKIVHVEDNDQLTYTSAYIHKNCCELREWKNQPQKYLWSSYQDYLGVNRWSGLLETKTISEQFDNSEEYFEWVQSNPAKDEKQ